jgi:hypothetical protein
MHRSQLAGTLREQACGSMSSEPGNKGRLSMKPRGIARIRVPVLAILCLSLAVVAAAGVIAATGSDSRASRPSANQPGISPFPPSVKDQADMKAAVLRTSTEAGEPNPTNVRVFATSRAAAEQALADARVDSDQPVYAIVLEGSFVSQNAPRPAGTPAPSSRYITMTWDPQTRDVVDFGLPEVAPNTSSLGPSLTLIP